MRNTLTALLEHRVVPVINENDVVAVDELAGEAFGDNDTLSAMCANLIDADLLVLLGETEGLYTSDPYLDPGARLVRVVRLPRMTSTRWRAAQGREGRGAWRQAGGCEAGHRLRVTVFLACGREPDVLLRLSRGDKAGTLFPASGSKMESRKGWMLSGLSTRGEIVVDDGAGGRAQGAAQEPASRRGHRGGGGVRARRHNLNPGLSEGPGGCG